MLLSWALTCVSCVSDSFPEGLPCDGPDDACPPGQTCFAVGTDSLCYSSQPDPPDAAPIVIDAPPAFDAPVSFDAFVGPCDPIAQNCPNDDACYWQPMGDPVCETEGSGIFRQACVANADCRAGLGCFPAGMAMQCLPYCDTNNGMPCSGLDTCMPLAAPVGVCVFGGCDPLAQNCTPNEGCYIDEAMSNATQCLPEGTSVHGDPCVNNSDCEAGTQCTSCGKCGTFCDVNNGSVECVVHADGTLCQQIDGDVGACGSCI